MFYPHFTDQETETHSDEIILSNKVPNPVSGKPGSVSSQPTYPLPSLLEKELGSTLQPREDRESRREPTSAKLNSVERLGRVMTTGGRVGICP